MSGCSHNPFCSAFEAAAVSFWRSAYAVLANTKNKCNPCRIRPLCWFPVHFLTTTWCSRAAIWAKLEWSQTGAVKPRAQRHRTRSACPMMPMLAALHHPGILFPIPVQWCRKQLFPRESALPARLLPCSQNRGCRQVCGWTWRLLDGAGVLALRNEQTSVSLAGDGLQLALVAKRPPAGTSLFKSCNNSHSQTSTHCCRISKNLSGHCFLLWVKRNFYKSKFFLFGPCLTNTFIFDCTHKDLPWSFANTLTFRKDSFLELGWTWGQSIVKQTAAAWNWCSDKVKVRILGTLYCLLTLFSDDKAFFYYWPGKYVLMKGYWWLYSCNNWVCGLWHRREERQWSAVHFADGGAITAWLMAQPFCSL